MKEADGDHVEEKGDQFHPWVELLQKTRFLRMDFGEEEILHQISHGTEGPIQKRQTHFPVHQSGIRMIGQTSIFAKPGGKHLP
jgi:hypothetical protein